MCLNINNLFFSFSFAIFSILMDKITFPKTFTLFGESILSTVMAFKVCQPIHEMAREVLSRLVGAPISAIGPPTQPSLDTVPEEVSIDSQAAMSNKALPTEVVKTAKVVQKNTMKRFKSPILAVFLPGQKNWSCLRKPTFQAS